MREEYGDVIGAYTRVSTRKQERDGYSLQVQAERGRAFARQLGADCLVFAEARSGKNLEARTEWQRLERSVECGAINKVWIIDGDRLARKQLHSLKMLAFLEEHSVPLFVGDRQIDYDSPDDIMVFQINQAVAERNGRAIIKSTTRGIRASIDAGKHPSSFLYGYRIGTRDVGGKAIWTIDEKEAAAIRRAFELYAAGNSVRSIAQALNDEGYRARGGVGKKRKEGPVLFAHSRVMKLLRNPRYAAMVRNREGKLIPSLVYPPIVDAETWKKARARDQKNPFVTFARKADHLLSGVLRCAKCGQGYNHHRYFTNEIVGGVRMSDHAYVHDDRKKCDQHPVRVKADPIEELATFVFWKTARDKGAMKRAYEKETKSTAQESAIVDGTIKRIEERVAELDRQKARIIDKVAEGTFEEGDIKSKLRSIADERESLLRDREAKERESTALAEKRDAIVSEYAADRIEQFEKAAPRERRELLRRLIVRFEINGRMLRVETLTGKRYEAVYSPAMDIETLYRDEVEWTVFDEFYQEVEAIRGKRRAAKGPRTLADEL